MRATQRPESFVIADLYAPDCVSIEAAGNVDRGHAGIEAKGKRWEAMQKSTKWTARNVFTGKNVICIEWDAEVTLRDGRVVNLPEVAVHEIKGGKIVRERYYYNPGRVRAARQLALVSPGRARSDPGSGAASPASRRRAGGGRHPRA